MTHLARWRRIAVELVLAPAAIWLLVMSAAPQFREYALEALLVWIGAVAVRHLLASSIATALVDQDLASPFDAFVRRASPSVLPVAQRVDADRLAALAADPGVFDREILPLLRDVADGPLDDSSVARRDLAGLMAGLSGGRQTGRLAATAGTAGTEKP